MYLYLTGFWQASGGANGRRVTGWGRVGTQQVVERGRYISASAGGITVDFFKFIKLAIRMNTFYGLIWWPRTILEVLLVTG